MLGMQVLLQHKAKVYMAGRGREKAEAAIAELKALTGMEAIYLEIDLSNLASVRKAAEEFLSKESALHILFNNAYDLFSLSKLYGDLMRFM